MEIQTQTSNSWSPFNEFNTREINGCSNPRIAINSQFQHKTFSVNVILYSSQSTHNIFAGLFVSALQWTTADIIYMFLSFSEMMCVWKYYYYGHCFTNKLRFEMRYYGAIKTVGKSAHKDDYKCAREKSIVAGSNCIQVSECYTERNGECWKSLQWLHKSIIPFDINTHHTLRSRKRSANRLN